MSKVRFFSVYDKAADAFLPPFVMPTKGMAIRSFMDACRDPDKFGAHAADFVLFFVGEFDEVSGHVDNVNGPEKLMTALDAVASLREGEETGTVASSVRVPDSGVSRFFPLRSGG